MFFKYFSVVLLKAMSYLFLQSSPFGRRLKWLDMFSKFSKIANTEQLLKENPFYEKYASKISELQKTSRNVEPLQQNLKSQVLPSCKEILPKKQGQGNGTKTPHFQGKTDLNQVMKIEAVQEKTAKEIELIWKQYHQVKDGIYAVLPSDAYEKMYLRFKKYPTFLFPLPRAQGYEFVMCQFLQHSCYFTSLINYQAFKENAPVCLTITYFTEFLEKKGIVLMRGEYDATLKSHEAQCLANQLQLYYGSNDAKKENLLWSFNNKPETFKHMDLISDFEYGLGK